MLCPKIKRDQLREGVDGLLKQLAKNRPTLPTRGQCGIQKSVHDGDVQVELLFCLISSIFNIYSEYFDIKEPGDLAAGEDRVIEQPGLTALQSLFHRLQQFTFHLTFTIHFCFFSFTFTNHY